MHSKKLNEDWNKAMDSISDGALGKLSDEIKRNAFIPANDAQAIDGLQILFYSSYWTSALHHLGIRPGGLFPLHSSLCFTVHKDSAPHIHATELGFMDVTKILNNIPTGSMFESSRVFIWDHVRASMVYSITNNGQKKNLEKKKSSKKSGTSKSLVRSNGNGEGSSAMDVDDDGKKNTTQIDMEGSGDLGDGMMDSGLDGAAVDADLGIKSGKEKNKRKACTTPKSNSIVSESQDRESMHSGGNSFPSQSLKNKKNMIPIFKALLAEGDKMCVEKNHSSGSTVEETSLDPRTALGLARLFASLITNASVREAAEDEDWIRFATKSLTLAAHHHIQSMEPRKKTFVKDQVIRDYHYLFGNNSINLTSVEAIQNAVGVLEKDMKMEMEKNNSD